MKENKKEWEKRIDIRAFIKENVRPYDGDGSFLVGPSEKTKKVWQACLDLLAEERGHGGVLAIDANTVSMIASHRAGYIDRETEVIVGLQTDAPLKRGLKPFGGIRAAEAACLENGSKLDEKIKEIFTKYRKTHNDGVFDAYTEEIRNLRRTGVLTGLPDAYARGRIIGDYRRVALYGIDRLLAEKEKDKAKLIGTMSDDTIRLREEVSDQIRALTAMKVMAAAYGCDISQPAQTAREAVQWTYFGILSALKEQDGAAMSLGSVSAFLDIFIEKDLQAGLITEIEAQELIDQLVIKLRFVRHLRTQEYNQLFAGDPTWLTESLGGTWQNGQHKVTKTTYRFLQTLYNLGPSPEPNLTILWSTKLPQNFKDFCAKVSIETSSIQYCNDDLMRRVSCHDDYGISCCVSKLKLGKQMQFFGARCNLAKALLLALNDGVDEMSGAKVLKGIGKLSGTELDYTQVWEKYRLSLAKLAKSYANTMNIIHYMHDKYYYEAAQMALLDTKVERVMAFGIAGLSVVADSLSAIKYAKVAAVRNEKGLITEFSSTGEYPQYGNDDDRVDSIAKEIVDIFYHELKKHKIYRKARPTLSVLTITSNVVYGKKTGSTPDGRLTGAPFAPGANPMHGRDISGARGSLNSVAKLSYESAEDGISNTFSVTPRTLGADLAEQKQNLVILLDGYFFQDAHHLNVNVLDKKTLEDAMEHPELYPQLTIRVSGYAVNFVKLSREQQLEVLRRTFFEQI